jgi:antirestriction protein ArdC
MSLMSIDNAAAYIGGWLKQLQNDRTLIFHAAAQAQRAADFILGNAGSPSEVHP